MSKITICFYSFTHISHAMEPSDDTDIAFISLPPSLRIGTGNAKIQILVNFLTNSNSMCPNSTEAFSGLQLFQLEVIIKLVIYILTLLLWALCNISKVCSIHQSLVQLTNLKWVECLSYIRHHISMASNQGRGRSHNPMMQDMLFDCCSL